MLRDSGSAHDVGSTQLCPHIMAKQLVARAPATTWTICCHESRLDCLQVGVHPLAEAIPAQRVGTSTMPTAQVFQALSLAGRRRWRPCTEARWTQPCTVRRFLKLQSASGIFPRQGRVTSSARAIKVIAFAEAAVPNARISWSANRLFSGPLHSVRSYPPAATDELYANAAADFKRQHNK